MSFFFMMMNFCCCREQIYLLLHPKYMVKSLFIPNTTQPGTKQFLNKLFIGLNVEGNCVLDETYKKRKHSNSI